VFRDAVPKDPVPHRALAGGGVELPCFSKVQRIDLSLGYLGLAVR
jgi:hypothetical protein